ncbi:PHP domain-containing protein [Clostridium bowmanii]|uniref:PHP domain-containing protein n=1 Tax=Clostridium bowmanii TaxID=132925 RepID=UPI001C0C71E2|nr:PHP domain-containing protein [Clostridium bowmanii]MBU3189657.1 PHP domain-containing protein [Clostridium bowmanii]MCA1073498.1 PHP domain-containing protein [Clostridium bowmanii]
MKADFHVHTTMSDGSMNFDEVISMAISNEVTHLGITNHDTVKGLSEAIIAGEKAGIKIVPGIEISAFDFETGRKIHILGFNFNLEAANIKKLCDPILERRHNNSLWQIGELKKNGYIFNIDNIYSRAKSSEVIYKQHIMAELTEADYSSKVYSDLYKKLFKGDGICARDIEYVDATDAVRAIKEDGGIAILAHPGQLDSYSSIDKLVIAGLDGIELYHEDHGQEDYIKVMQYCRIHYLITTGGSDFHGSYGSSAKIGQKTSAEEFIHAFDYGINYKK